jgi:hypothetical protein
MTRANGHVTEAEMALERLKRDAHTGVVLTPREAEALVALIETLRWERGY